MAACQVHARESEQLKCGLCESLVETLLSKCVDCNVFMCVKCTKAHTNIKLTSKHRIIADQLGPLPTKKSKSLCTYHPAEDVGFYCYTCDTLICSECITGSHSNHRCSKIKTAARDMEKELLGLLSDFRKNNIVLSLKAEKVEKLQQENELQGNRTIKDINMKMEELSVEIITIAENLNDESRLLQENNERKLMKIHKDIIQEISKTEKLHKEYSNILDMGSDVDKILATEKASNEIRNLQSNDYEIKVQIPKFKTQIGRLSALKNIFGCLDDEIKKKLSDDQDKLFKFLPQRAVEVEEVVSFEHKSKTVESICTLKNDRVLLHYSNEFDKELVTICDRKVRQLKMAGKITFDFVVSDFISISDGSIMATAFNEMKIYRLFKQAKRMSGVIDTKPLYPLCLCESCDGTILVTMVDKVLIHVDSKSRRLITRMDLTGNTLETYEYDGHHRLFTIPLGITENLNREICVVNKTGNNRSELLIIGRNGRKKVTYGTGGQNSDMVRVKCDNNGYLIICDCSNKEVQILSSKAEFIGQLMNNQDLKHQPYSQAIDNQGLLWVGCYKGLVHVIKYTVQDTVVATNN